MPTGTIKKLVADKGFGFIKTQDGKDIFFHHSVVADQGFDNLSEGQKVEFSIEQGSDKGKGPRAGSVTPAGRAEFQPLPGGLNGRRFSLRALFFVTFLAASWSLGLRLVADAPDAGLLIIGAVAWGSIFAIALISALFR